MDCNKRAGKDQLLASGEIHQPKSKQREHQIHQADQHRLKEGVAGGGAGRSENLREKREQSGVMPLSCEKIPPA